VCLWSGPGKVMAAQLAPCSSSVFRPKSGLETDHRKPIGGQEYLGHSPLDDLPCMTRRTEAKRKPRRLPRLLSALLDTILSPQKAILKDI
jgi:hypothetical protein